MLGHTSGALTLTAATTAATTANKQIHSGIGHTVVLGGSRKQDMLLHAVSGLSKQLLHAGEHTCKMPTTAK
jgi:hypothetical protein